MSANGAITHVCETSGCNSEAKLQCPTCIKLGIQGSFFCSQSCFKGSWDSHKLLHKKTKTPWLTQQLDNYLQYFPGYSIVQRAVTQFKNISGASDSNSSQYNPWPYYMFTGSLRPYPQSNKREVPPPIGRPDYADDPNGFPHSEQKLRGSTNIKCLSDEEIEGMRVACKLAREVLDEGVKAAGIGVTTDEVDRIVHEAAVERECYPSPLNYHGFPKSCCTSINEVICHGIPDMRPLQNGDICNIDVTVYHRNFHGDLNETLFIGEVNSIARNLVKTTWECLQKSIEIVKPGVKYRDVGAVIQKHAHSQGFSVVRSYCGHGIHQLFHTAPSVPHYTKNKAVGIMKPGHTFTIEPMISEGTWKDEQWPDNWTAVTADGKLSAQFEETLLVTETGVEILTQRRERNGQPYFTD
ncbi:methionine aminopeptidase 1-like isoform X1 [Homarus americanus]|uniref:methionine aminopeptidase 1-like isoform X1 n=1 Tax=Homarus americanus TaxID=6706 RepID=UPI001C48ACB9|nr:methionine aminopeptidase 1-like isoform X1 [Homarus americanus]